MGFGRHSITWKVECDVYAENYTKHYVDKYDGDGALRWLKPFTKATYNWSYYDFDYGEFWGMLYIDEILVWMDFYALEYCPSTELYISYTHLRPMGFIEGPLRPPEIFESMGLAISVLMAIAFIVFIATIPSPLASFTACAISVILLIVYRRFTRALFTMIPVGIVIGWVSLSLYLAGIPLNTMSAPLGVLVIGIGTEFIVLLLGRYEEEKKHRDETPHDAMVVAISRTGRAIVTTALTTLGGFAVLIVSNFVMVRDFGIATTFGVVLCLISSLVVMPPLVVWWDTRVAHRLPENL